MANSSNMIPAPEGMQMSGDLAKNWEVFRAEFEDFVLATGLNEKAEEVQAAALRRLMGSECRHIYMHNVILDDDQKKDPTAILDALGEHFKPEKNVIYERYKFGCCKQETDEPIDSFITRLRERAASCEYRGLKDEMIRDKLVLGVASENTRRRLLRERDLMLATAVGICRLAELTDTRMKTLESPQLQTDSVNSADRQYGRRGPQDRRGRDIQQACKYCGNSHKRGREQCPAYGKACRSCGISNHFSKVCQASSKTKKVNALEDVEQGDTDTDDMFLATECISNIKSKGLKWFVHLRLNKKKQACQLDTGATCNVMSRKIKEKLSPRTALQQSTTKLKLYSGETMLSQGRFHTECVIRGKKHDLVFEVVETQQEPLLSGATCERLGLMTFTIPEELHKIEADQCTPLTKDQLLSNYTDIFNGPIESVPGEIHFELDPNIPPVQCAPRNVPVALREKVKEELDRHIRAGNITPVSEPTAWISNMVTVAKPEKIRLCIDPKPLNRALLRSHYHMPTLEDVLYKLPKARIFTLVDARDAFLQCKLDDESSRLTTFWTPWGRMRWLKLPFGVSVAPEIYQRKQHELLAGLAGIEPIADDILVVGSGDTEVDAERDHDTNLRALMERCRAVKLRLSERKLQFKLQAVHFHGHILSSEGLKIDPEKTRAVLEMPTPTDAKAVQRFIGFVTYLAKFLPKLSEVCEPLRRLLDKDTEWHWLAKHEDAVQEIKRLVSNTPVLRYYDVTKPVTVQSDASMNGLGCCLLQGGQPVAFASRALTQTEQNYAQIEKECLSIVFACQRFHQYLYGRETLTAETDHKPLITIFKKPLLSAPKRLQGMLMQLQCYNLDVVYKPGPEMYVSDTLSRATLPHQGPDTPHVRHAVFATQTEYTQLDQAQHLNVTTFRFRQITQHTETDDVLQELKTVILDGWPDFKEDTPLAVRDYWPFRDELNVQNGVLYRGQCIIIPKALRAELLKRIHSSHIGGEACYRRARDTLFWPGMRAEIKDYVANCSACNEYARNQQKESMMSHEIPTRPWQTVSMDIYSYAGKEFLILVDHYSDYWEIDQLPDLSANTLITRCRAQFARYGQPDKVISDNGPQFACEQFRKFATSWGFSHVTSSPRHPKSNGKAEAAVKIVKSLCKRAKLDGTDAWMAILHWRNTPTEGLDSSPAQRLMSRRLKTSLPVADSLLQPHVVIGVTEKLRWKRRVVKSTYDRSARDLPELNVGDRIRMKPLPGDRTGRWPVGQCIQKVAPRSFVVDVNGTLYRRNRVDLRVAERSAEVRPMGRLEQNSPEQGHMTEKSASAETGHGSSQGEPDGMEDAPHTSSPAPHPLSTPEKHSCTPGQEVFTRCGRLSRPPQRLNW